MIRFDQPENAPAPLGIRVHYDDILPEDVTTIEGIPVSAPARTLLDLATCVDDEELAEAFRRAFDRGLTTKEELWAVMERYPNHSGCPRLRALLGA